MNGQTPTDGGILYDATETDDEDDLVEVTEAERPAPAIGWAESLPEAAGLKGAELIQAFVKRLPNGPGVYRMLNEAGDVLYVGKARSLKKRVSNYAQGRGHSNRIARMVRETAHMEFVTTRTEIEALLLEANLIKRLRPRFNVLLRDDKSFPYIVVTGDTRAPALYKHRGARSRKGDYFGPFASAGAVGRTINSLQRAFLLRTCTDSVFETRTRPCLLYQIKRCSAPCTNEVSDADYAELVSEAKDFLSGKSQAVKATIASAMAEASENLDFERAALYRDRLAALSHVQSHQGINPAGVEEADVFAIHHEGGISCIQVFFFRTGQNWGNRAYFPKADPSIPLPRCSARFLRSSMTTSPVRGRSCSAPPSRNRNCLHRRSARNPATRSRSSCRSAERRRISSSMRSQTPARRMAASSPKRLRRGACSKALPQPSNSLTCRAASRSTTTRILWAPMRWAAWSSPARRASSKASTESST